MENIKDYILSKYPEMSEEEYWFITGQLVYDIDVTSEIVDNIEVYCGAKSDSVLTNTTREFILSRESVYQLYL